LLRIQDFKEWGPVGMDVKKWLFLGLRLIALPAIHTQFTASAPQPTRKAVRMGWYDSSSCHWEEFGGRCSIDIELTG
jgi:hypothetical protein